jgi:hypothetical protein
MMSKPPATEFVTPEHLLKSAAYALEQSRLLLRDANTLYRSKAYASAVSPDALLVPGRADGRARTVATGSLRQPGFAQAVFVSGEIFRTTER